ncbi:MAG: hypothetical protein IJW82_06420 [Clostridia bacterium]|nr:hypothetical protein [Clostridia bacterium]
MSSDHRSAKKPDKKLSFNEKHPMLSWALLATFMTVVLSSLFSFLSETVLTNTSIIISCVIAIVFVLLNVITDTLGVSVTACEKTPFLAMASNKIKGAKEALILIDNADKISNICSDIIGDICGIMSGAVGANIVTQILLLNNGSMNSIIVSVLISTSIAAITVFFKAIGKYLATRYYTQIVLFTSKVLSIFIKKKRRKKKKKTK